MQCQFVIIFNLASDFVLHSIALHCIVLYDTICILSHRSVIPLLGLLQTLEQAALCSSIYISACIYFWICIVSHCSVNPLLGLLLTREQAALCNCVFVLVFICICICVCIFIVLYCSVNPWLGLLLTPEHAALTQWGVKGRGTNPISICPQHIQFVSKIYLNISPKMYGI